MTVVATSVAVALALAAMLALVRIARGPSLLDRLVSIEVLLSVSVSAVGTVVAVNRDATLLPIMMALTMLGFIGSVSVVRTMIGGRQ
jgi:multicomponent Na+:H+ antiporter subunit F